MLKLTALLEGPSGTYSATWRAIRLWLLAGAIALPVRLLIAWIDPRYHSLLDIGIELALYGLVALPFILVTVAGQRSADERFQQTREALADVVEHSGDVIFTLDWDGRWTWANAAAERVLGVAPAALVGTAFMERTARSHLKDEMAAFRAMLRGEEYVDFETVHLDAQGHEVALSVSVRVQKDERGAVVGVQGIAHDISERAAAMAALMEAHEAAAAAARAKASFMANVSHEIRTPMHGVLGTTRLLLEHDLGPDQRRLAEIIRESGETLLKVIDQVLDFSKLEAGRLELEDAVFALPEAAEAVVRLFGAQASERGVTLVLDVGAGVPAMVSGDAPRLRQVLSNLVGNALKFTPAGGTVALCLAGEASDGAPPRVRFSVRDSGIGIAPDRLARIFEAFAQADSSTTRRYGGSGLGLAIARQIVAAMAGELTVASVQGEGATFSFVVPLRQLPGEQADAPARRVTADALVGPAAGTVDGTARVATGTPRRVLVVDDNDVNRLIAVAMLRARGHQAQAVDSGRAAIAAAATGQFDLVLMDVQMPDLDGMAATRAIRDDGMTVPVVALTSHAFAEERTRCLENGMCDVLTKPYTPEALQAMVERWAADGAPAPAATAVAADAPPAEGPDVDVAGLQATLREAGIGSLFPELVGGFLRDAPARMAAIETAAAAGDADALSRAAHAYKGSAGAVAARGLAADLGRLEASARAGNLEAAPALVARLRIRHHHTLERLASAAALTDAEGVERWSGTPALIARAG